MPSVPRRFWQDMTTTEFGGADAQRWIAVLPVGAIEQHGPHLPLCVDACINQGILERALELLPERLPVTILPPMPVGKSNEHIAFPGTLTLSAETLIRLWTELGEAVARAGVRKLVLFNSHGGQPPVMDIVTRTAGTRRASRPACSPTTRCDTAFTPGRSRLRSCCTCARTWCLWSARRSSRR
jgi:creatinine amidohydrolase